MNESTITTLFKGEFVMVDMVDETIELTVENNVYSHSESYELLDELQKACAVIRKANSMLGDPINSKSKPYDKIGVPTSGSYDNTLSNLIEEIENRAEALRNKKGVDDEGH